MTVLETEEDADKRSVPPRKKFCLSLSGRRRAIPIVVSQPPHTSTRGGLLDTSNYSLSMHIFFLITLYYILHGQKVTYFNYAI